MEADCESEFDSGAEECVPFGMGSKYDEEAAPQIAKRNKKMAAKGIYYQLCKEHKWFMVPAKDERPLVFIRCGKCGFTLKDPYCERCRQRPCVEEWAGNCS